MDWALSMVCNTKIKHIATQRLVTRVWVYRPKYHKKDRVEGELTTNNCACLYTNNQEIKV